MHVTHDYICRALNQMYQHCPKILLSGLVNTECVYAVVVGLKLSTISRKFCNLHVGWVQTIAIRLMHVTHDYTCMYWHHYQMLVWINTEYVCAESDEVLTIFMYSTCTL